MKSFKVICVGESTVGKTSLIQRLCDDTFEDHQVATISTDFKVKTVCLGTGEPGTSSFKPTEHVKMNIWDTAG